MFNLFDILQAQAASQGSNGVGQQFGLSPEQSRRALEALLPAFTIGLQRNAANDPMGLAHLFGLAGAKPAPAPQPEVAMMQLFGSPMVSQAVIRQAASASGVASPILRQMMPVLAGMVVAGIVHLLLNPPAAEPAAPQTFGFPPNPFWTEMMNGLAASAPAASPGLRPNAPPPDKPRAGRPAIAAPKPAGQASAASGRHPGGSAFDMLQNMFQTGMDAHEQNVKAMQGIFDSLWTAKPPSNDEAPPKATTPKRG